MHALLPPAALALFASASLAQTVESLWFGYGSTWVEDLNGDGWHDVALTDPEVGSGEAGAPSQGAVVMLSGVDGSVLGVLEPGAHESRFGWSVAALDDLDEDGVGELAVWGSADRPGEQAHSYVRTLSPKSGAVLWEHRAAPNFTWTLGMGRIPDVNGDGVAEVAAWGADPAHADESDVWQSLQVLSGSDGELLVEHARRAPTWLRLREVRAIEDQDGDGQLDFVVLTYEIDERNVRHERVEIRSGASDELIARLPLAVELENVLEVADLDGDGSSEILLTAASDPFGMRSNPNGEPDPGSVIVLDVEERAVERVLIVRNQAGTRRPARALGVVDSPTRRLLVAGTPSSAEESLFALDVADENWKWTIGGQAMRERAKSDEWLTDHLGEWVEIDPRADAEGGRSGLSGTANPHWGHAHTVWCFDAWTGETRFIVDAGGVRAAAGF